MTWRELTDTPCPYCHRLTLVTDDATVECHHCTWARTWAEFVRVVAERLYRK